MFGRLLCGVLALLLGVFGCSGPKETAPKTETAATKEAPAKTPEAPKAKPAATEATPTPTTPAQPKACSEDEVRKGVEFLHSPAMNPDMLTILSLQSTSMACEKHRGTVDIVKHLTNARLDRDAKRRAYAEGIWKNMGLLERGCPAGQKVLNHIGAQKMDGKPAQVALAQHCRFVEKGLVTKAELPSLDNGYVPLVPIFQTLMADSKVDPALQRVLLRGILGLTSKPLKK